MSSVVTIPVASYLNKLNPENCPSRNHFDQQTKLWRFYCTCLDLNCVNYKLEDFLDKNYSTKEKYEIWLKGWNKHYNDVSDLIRKYKKARSSKWFHAKEQEQFREKLRLSIIERFPKTYSDRVNDLEWYYEEFIRENLDKLRRSAQHLLNARFTAKLASQALVSRQKAKKVAFKQAAE